MRKHRPSRFDDTYTYRGQPLFVATDNGDAHASPSLRRAVDELRFASGAFAGHPAISRSLPSTGWEGVR